MLTTTDKRTHSTLTTCPAHRIVFGLIINIICGMQHILGCCPMCLFFGPHFTIFLYVSKVLISVLSSDFSICVLPSLREMTFLEHTEWWVIYAEKCFYVFQNLKNFQMVSITVKCFEWLLRSKSIRNINPLQTKLRPLYLKTQSVPRCKHFSSRL